MTDELIPVSEVYRLARRKVPPDQLKTTLARTWPEAFADLSDGAAATMSLDDVEATIRKRFPDFEEMTGHRWADGI